MVKKQVTKTVVDTDKKEKKDVRFKDMMKKTVRMTIAIFIIIGLLGTIVHVVPFTIIFVGGLIGISVQVALNSADFYVWILSSLFIVALYTYFTIKAVLAIWRFFSVSRRDKTGE